MLTDGYFYFLRCKQENRHPVPPRVKPEISQHMYRDIFNYEFNLGFALPRTDTCATCDSLSLLVKSLEGKEREEKAEELKEHQEVKYLISILYGKVNVLIGSFCQEFLTHQHKQKYESKVSFILFCL